MNSYLISVVVVAILDLVTCTVQVHAVQDSASLDPVNPVKRVGDEIPFVCMSPANYFGERFVSVEFVLEHNGTDIFGRVEADSVLNTRSITTFPRFSITSKQDAGIYTCTITPSPLEEGKVVSAKTEVFVIEANEMTQFGEVKKETKLSCLGTDDKSNLQLVTFWNIDGKTSANSTYVIPKTAKIDVFKTFTCQVTSKQAMAAYGNMTNAANKGAVTEFTRSLSVIEVTDCKDRSSCVLEARVYGETRVNISWMIDGKLYSPLLVVEKNVTRSKTSLLNLTSTTPIELHISDGPDNIWRKNMTLSQDTPSGTPGETSSNVGPIVGGVLGGVVCVVCVALFIVCCVIKKRNERLKKSDGPETVRLNETTTPEKGKEEKKGDEKDKEKETATMNCSCCFASR